MSVPRAVATFVVPAAVIAVLYFGIYRPLATAPLRAEEADLRRYLTELSANEEQRLLDSARFGDDAEVLPADSLFDRRFPAPAIVAGDSSFSAVLTSDRFPALRCAVAIGTPNPLTNDTTAGLIACR